MLCPTCSRENPAGTEYCIYCGIDVSAQNQTSMYSRRSSNDEYGSFNDYLDSHPQTARRKKPTKGLCSGCESNALEFYDDGSGVCRVCGREFRWDGRKSPPKKDRTAPVKYPKKEEAGTSVEWSGEDGGADQAEKDLKSDIETKEKDLSSASRTTLSELSNIKPKMKSDFKLDWVDRDDAIDRFINDDLPSNVDKALKEKMQRLNRAYQEELLSDEEYRELIERMKRG